MLPLLAGLESVAVFTPVNSLAQSSPKSPYRMTPPGSYSSWSTEDREHVPGKVVRACQLAAVMGTSSYSGPKDLRIELAELQTLTCIVEQMPADWPQRASAREQALKHRDAALSLDGSISIPDVPN
jgi:hypothetical protein